MTQTTNHAGNDAGNDASTIDAGTFGAGTSGAVNDAVTVGTGGAVEDDVITLRLPASARWIRLARLVATGVANSAGFDADTLEDARVAVDEVCGLLVERTPTSPIDVAFRAATGSIHVRASCRVGGEVDPPDGLAVDVLKAVTTSWDWIADGGSVAIEFVVSTDK